MENSFLVEVKRLCPKGRLGRQSLERLQPWLAEWSATGHTLAASLVALQRYLAMDENPERFPTVAQLAHHAGCVTDEAMREAERQARYLNEDLGTPQQRRKRLKELAEAQLVKIAGGAT